MERPVTAVWPQGREPGNLSPPWGGFPFTSCLSFSPRIRVFPGHTGVALPDNSPLSTVWRDNCSNSGAFGLISASVSRLLWYGCSEPGPSASASLGVSAKLTCTLSGEHSTFYIHWCQQTAAKAPQYVMKVKGDGSHSKGHRISDRLSVFRCGADRYLTICKRHPEDKAEYYRGTAQSFEGQTQYIYNGDTKGKRLRESG